MCIERFGGDYSGKNYDNYIMSRALLPLACVVGGKDGPQAPGSRLSHPIGAHAVFRRKVFVLRDPLPHPPARPPARPLPIFPSPSFLKPRIPTRAKHTQYLCPSHQRAYPQCDLPQLCDAPQRLYGVGVSGWGARGISFPIDVRRQQAGNGAPR